MSNSIKRDVVLGIFDLLKQWWVWLAFIIMTGFATGSITSGNITNILQKTVTIVKGIK